MPEGKFPYADSLRQRVNRAAGAVQDLQLAVHYMRCDRAADRQPRHFPAGAAGYHVQVVMDETAPVSRLTYWEFVEAETPLEALVKLAQQGRLSPTDKFLVRVALEVDDNRVVNVLTIPVTTEITMPTVTH